jgi:2-keto-3-deoxy-L-arabinonate dehydratase
LHPGILSAVAQLDRNLSDNNSFDKFFFSVHFWSPSRAKTLSGRDRKGRIKRMDIQGTYPMLYAFFADGGALRSDAFTPQIEAAIASGAAGIACLGLATEAHKLGLDERRQVVDRVMEAVDGRVPVAVTVTDGNVPDMIAFARYAESAGASWLILQPPRPPATGADLGAFFAAVAASTRLPCAIQNAPEFLGIGLTADELLTLNAFAPNVRVVKGEGPATEIARMVADLQGRMTVMNGRAGLELTDNYRAGVVGMIPGIETIDLQVAVERAMRAGDEARAEAIYASVLPTISFVMQGLATLVTYGKLIAALRLGITPSARRIPSMIPTHDGIAWARRLAASLGPLPT